MVSFGPERVVNQLKRVVERPNVQEFLSNMERFKEKLDQYHRHVVLFSTGNLDSFHLFVAVDHLGRKTIGVSIVNPFEKNLAIYTLPLRVQMDDVYEEMFNVQPGVHRCGIVKLPLNFKMVCGLGDEDFLGKEIFKERVYGERKLSFAELVDSSTYERLVSLNNATVDLVTIRLLDEGILCLARAPSDADKTHVPLLAEIAQLLKSRYKFSCEVRYKNIVASSPILTSVCIDYEKFLSGFDVQDFCREFSKKLKQAYECILRLI